MGTNKSTLKIAAATSMSMFSLLTCFSGVWAWFTSTHVTNNGSSGFSIMAGSGVNILSAYAVQYDGHAGARAVNLLDDGPHSVSMSEYDYIFTDRNVNTPLFFRIEMTGFEEDQNVRVTIPCSTSYFAPGTTNVINSLSNVVGAKFLTGLGASGSIPDNNDFEASDANQRSINIRNSFEGMLAHASTVVGTPFVTDSSNKANMLTLELSGDVAFDPDMLVDGVDDQNNPVKKAVLYVGLDYHLDESVQPKINLVDEYIKSYQGASHSLEFTPDIGTITLDVEDVEP